MSLKECYDKMGADYEDVLSRLRSEVLVRKFALKFLQWEWRSFWMMTVMPI